MDNYYEAKHDNDKLRYDLLSVEWLEGLAEVATYGAKKYDDNTWQTVPDGKKRYTAAAFRHFIAWIKGEQLDSESNLHHLKHAAFNLLMLLSLERNNNETN